MENPEKTNLLRQVKAALVTNNYYKIRIRKCKWWNRIRNSEVGSVIFGYFVFPLQPFSLLICTFVRVNNSMVFYPVSKDGQIKGGTAVDMTIVGCFQLAGVKRLAIHWSLLDLKVIASMI